MGLPDGLTSENQTLGALWGGWEVTKVRQNCTAVSHAIFNSTTVQGHVGKDPKKTVQTNSTGAEVHLSQTRASELSNDVWVDPAEKKF